MFRKSLTVLLGLILLLGIAAMATAPGALDHVAPVPEVNRDPGAWIAAREADVHRTTPILPGTEKRVRWYDGRDNVRTRHAVVYLHGFSATRQEVAPVGEMIADALGANLFETRLAGHGLVENPMADVRAESWLNDGAEALVIGAAIGERIVLIGTSTGATLAVAMIGHESFADVESLILMSPNFAVPDPSSEILTWPGGPQLARLMIGETRSWTAANELQDRYWATTYPTAALVEMMRLVKLARTRLPTTLEQSVLTIYSPNDGVIDTSWIGRATAQISARRIETIEVRGSGDPSNHVLAGDILSPETNQAITDHIVRFVRASDL